MPSSEVRQLPLEEVLELPVYPTADIFPMLLDQAEAPNSVQSMTMTINDFADQIWSDGGVKEPLVVWNGMLVDGRNRRAAAKIAKLDYVPVREETFADEDEADRFIIALNVARRQLTKSQTAAVAALYWPLFEGRHGGDRKSDQEGKSSTLIEGKTRDILSNMFRVNERYIDTAHQLFISDPENFKQLHEGKKNLTDVKKSPGQNIRNEVNPTKKAADGIARATQAIWDHFEVFENYETSQTDWLAYGKELLGTIRHGAKSFGIEISDEEYKAACRYFHLDILEGEEDYDE